MLSRHYHDTPACICPLVQCVALTLRICMTGCLRVSLTNQWQLYAVSVGLGEVLTWNVNFTGKKMRKWAFRAQLRWHLSAKRVGDPYWPARKCNALYISICAIYKRHSKRRYDARTCESTGSASITHEKNWKIFAMKRVALASLDSSASRRCVQFARCTFYCEHKRARAPENTRNIAIATNDRRRERN